MKTNTHLLKVAPVLFCSDATLCLVFMNDPDPDLLGYHERLCSHAILSCFVLVLMLMLRSYWDTSDDNIELLQDLYQEVEDKIEGV